MIEQIVIAVTGALAVWTSQSHRWSTRRWAPIIGLVGQPAWFYASWKAEQYGIVLLTFVYAAGWCRGLYVYWVRP